MVKGSNGTCDVILPWVEPIGDQVVVQRDEERVKIGSIVLPDNAKIHPRFGIVIAVGPGMLRANPPKDGQGGTSDYLPMQCRIGDRVILPESGRLVTLTDDPRSEVAVVHESQLLAIFR